MEFLEIKNTSKEPRICQGLFFGKIKTKNSLAHATAAHTTSHHENGNENRINYTVYL